MTQVENPEPRGVEIFEFHLEAGDMDGDDVERTAAGMGMAEGDIVPGSGRHIATVEAPSGTLDIVTYRVRHARHGPMWCLMVRHRSGAHGGCGDDFDVEPRNAIEPGGATSSDEWRSAEFRTQAQVVEVVGIAEDGTRYTITPANGFGFVEWKTRRGAMTLTAFDAAGDDAGTAVVGTER